MQPLTSSRSSTEAVSWKMCVPATLQPDGAWKRPAHTGPSLVEAPVGLQSPYCTRPPRWVQKQERRARRDRAPIRLVPARTASIYTVYGGPVQVRGGQTSHFIIEGHLSLLSPSNQKPFQPKKKRTDQQPATGKLTSRRNRNSVRLYKRSKEWRRRARTDKKQQFTGKDGIHISAWKDIQSCMFRA